MTFLKALRGSYTSSVLTFVGGGGKSTLMYLLAREFSSAGYAVLVSTTTMIYHPEIKNRPYDDLLIAPAKEILTLRNKVLRGCITVAASAERIKDNEHKLKGFSPEEIDILSAEYGADIILVEADGAKHLPIKAPGINEPVIPASSRCVFGVIGLDAMETVISPKTIFRMKEFSTLTGKHAGETVDREALVSLIQSENGLFKNSPEQAEKIVILNKADNNSRVKKGIEIASYILRKTAVPDKVLITAGQKSDTEGPVKALLNAKQKENP